MDKWVQVDHMEDMEKLVVQTQNSLYEITIIEGRSAKSWFAAANSFRS